MMGYNVMIFVLESFPYRKLFSIHKDFLTYINDFSIFHKCISMNNSSFMAGASIILGNPVCYDHNENFTWDKKETTCINDFGDTIFKILSENGYITECFITPFIAGTQLLRHSVLENDKIICEINGCSKVTHSTNLNESYLAIKSFIDNNLNNNFASIFWNYKDHFYIREKTGIDGYYDSHNKTLKLIEDVIFYLKENKIYDNTDIYIIGDHGDTYYIFSEITNEWSWQHGTIPFHTTTHVPLLVKNKNITDKEYCHLVSSVDLYKTILDSLNIKFNNRNNLPKQLSSMNLTSCERKLVITRVNFLKQEKNNGVAITDKNYIYVINNNDEYLFNHRIDSLNVINLLNIFKVGVGDGNDPHKRNWFSEDFKNIISKKLKYFRKIYNFYKNKGYLKDINFYYDRYS